MKGKLLFLAERLPCDALPHLAAGLRGEAYPRLLRRSEAWGPLHQIADMVWASTSLFGSAALLAARSSRILSWFTLISVAIGFTLLDLNLAWYFAKRRRMSGR